MKRAVLLALIICISGLQGHTPGAVAAAAALSPQDGRGPSTASPREARPVEGQRPATKESASRKSSPPVAKVSPERVLDALRSVVKESKDWKNAAASASIHAQIADLMWDADTGSARVYLAQAWELTGRIEESSMEASRFRNSSKRTNSQREVILVARTRAPELAKKWLEELAEENSSQKEQGNFKRGAFDDRSRRSTVLLQLALSAVEENPQSAVGLAVESLQDGISFGLQQVLLKLQEKKFELAKQVFSAALNRLRTVGMLDANELLILHSYLYTPGKISGANDTDNPSQSLRSIGRNPVLVKPAAEIDPALGLEFLKLASDLLINAPLPATTENPQLSARTQISVIRVLHGRVSQQLPEQALALQRRAQQIDADAGFVPAPQSARPDYVKPFDGEDKASYAQRRIDRMEELARKETDPLRRDIAYAEVALATAAGEYVRGVSLAGNIRDDVLRAQLADWIYARASLHFAQASNLDKAFELLKKIDDPSQKAICLVVGAQKLAEAKNILQAAEWLREARAIIKSAAPDEALTHIALGVVSAYAQFDDLAALESLTEAVKLINQSPVTSPTDDKAPLVRRFSGLAAADYTHGTNGFGLNAAARAFGQTWFENVLDSLGKITDAELRAGAIVTLCRKNLKTTNRSPL
jgi:hypothetical protein